MYSEQQTLVDRALQGDKQALETLLSGIQDMVYNLSLRMLGSPHDAEDAAQEVCIRIITGLSTFRNESAFSTWAYRVAANHLLSYKKSMFAKMPPLSFEYYGADIAAGFIDSDPAMMGGIDEAMLTEELKLSCTNVMLQCLDPESRLIFVLGTMFQADSKVCGEILGITPEAYRQRLSRIRRTMGGFLAQYCGLASGRCNCQKRVSYAIASHRLSPANLEYARLERADEDILTTCKEAMEEMDAQSQFFADLPKYRAPQAVRDFLGTVLASGDMQAIQRAQA